MDETKCGVTHHEGCSCHEAGWRRRMAGALEEAQTERDTATERRIERDDARAERDRYQQVAMDRTRERNDARAEVGRLTARVQQLGEEGRRALRERDEARAALAPFANLLTEYLAAPSGIDAISTHVRLDDVREARRALGLPLE